MDSLAIKTLPKGFVLDAPAPPPGFVLDAPPPPPGFVLDQPALGDVATAAQDWRDSGAPVSQNAQLMQDRDLLDPSLLPSLTQVGQPQGLIEPGNINLMDRPDVANADGTRSSVRSISVGIDGKEVLVPTVSDDGRLMSNEEAVEQYRRTGRHLGAFDSVEAANAYADTVHRQQEQRGTAGVIPQMAGGVHDPDIAAPATGPSIQELEARGAIEGQRENVGKAVSDLGEIGRALKMTATGTGPYKGLDDRLVKEWPKRIRWWERYVTTLGGRLGHNGLKEELLRDAEQFEGFGSVVMPAAGQTAVVAVEWGLVYPALFKAMGVAGKTLEQLPKVKAARDALSRAGGVRQLTKQYPRFMQAVHQAIQSFAKGAGAGGTVAGAEQIGKEKSIGEMATDVGKRAATVGAVASVFSMASSADTALEVRRFRQQLMQQIKARGDAKLAALPMGKADPGARNVIFHENMELRQMDNAVATYERALMDMKAGKMYRGGHEKVVKAWEKANRIGKYGYKVGRTVPKAEAGLKKGYATRPTVEQEMGGVPKTRVGEVVEDVKMRLKEVGKAKATRPAPIAAKPGTRPTVPTVTPAGAPTPTVQPRQADETVQIPPQAAAPGVAEKGVTHAVEDTEAEALHADVREPEGPRPVAVTGQEAGPGQGGEGVRRGRQEEVVPPPPPGFVLDEAPAPAAEPEAKEGLSREQVDVVLYDDYGEEGYGEVLSPLSLSQLQQVDAAASEAIHTLQEDAASILIEEFPTMGQALGLSYNDLMSRGPEFMANVMWDLRKTAREANNQEIYQKTLEWQTQYTRLEARQEMINTRIAEMKLSSAPVAEAAAAPESPQAEIGPPAPSGGLAEPAKRTPDAVLAETVEQLLSAGQKLTPDLFWQAADEAYGGSRAEGTYGPSQAYDALELGVNQWAARLGLDPSLPLESAQRSVKAVEDMLERIPSQTNRSGEKDAFQQFSTPPHYAFAINWIANVGKDDLVLEPSAGAGGIAVFAKNAGATVHVNEISPSRAALLEELGFDKVTTEDAEQIHNILKDRPSVVLMNPPFSHAAQRMGAKKIAGIDRKHIDAALALLQDNGRLVAIMGRPLQEEQGESRAFNEWIDGLKKKYNVRANVYVGRGVYKKYGTTFPTRVLVIDKIGPTTGEIEGGKVDTIDELLYNLSGVRDDRTRQIQQESRQPTGKRGASEARPEARPEPVTRPATTGARTPGVRAGRPDQPSTGRPSGTSEGTPQQRPQAGIEAGRPERPGRISEPERVGPESGRGTTGQPERVPAGAEARVEVTTKQRERAKRDELSTAVFEPYTPAKFYVAGAKKHPTALVESTAMASVDPPDVNYDLSIPQSVVTKGQLSDIQVENVAYAGMAFEGHVKLADGTEVRRGFLIGDGTGVGKGREISGIIIDQLAKGRGKGKAVWISTNKKLYHDAVRDWTALGQDKKQLFDLGRLKAGTEIRASKGVMYLTYGKLRTTSKKTNKPTVDQIVDWVGTDYDGVLVFDEAHKMGNAIRVKGVRGHKNPSRTALEAAKLRAKIPNARVLYVSATAATDPVNLAYLDRLGLWGPGTPFPSAANFVAQVEGSGINAMEQVARDMKAMGLFSSRSLSYNDGTEAGTVKFDKLIHELTPEQLTVYDRVAEAWQIVLRNVEAALKATEAPSGSALSQFWGANQRFFNQILTAMKTPTVIKAIEQDLKEDRSAIIQLTNTYEAAQDRALANRGEDVDLEDFDLTPIEILMQYVETSFPVNQYQTVLDENGNESQRLVTDASGNPVINRAAEERREQLLDELGAIRNIVPESPLDSVINHFGGDQVAEVTGRKQRVVSKKGKHVIEKRGANAGQADIDAFMAGKKRILIFSEAGGTGASYHADMDSENQQRRMHYVLQPGWRADVAMQGMGRSHRSNQKVAPWYKLVTTNLKGELRFVSTIARRLNQLGALQFGERKAGSEGLFSASDNLEGQEASDALHTFFAQLAKGKLSGISLTEFENQTGLSLMTREGNLRADLPDMKKFLNRLLNMKVNFQNQVFDAFSTIHTERVEQAMAEGTLDLGVQNYQADEIHEIERQTAYSHPTGGKTEYIKVRARYAVEPIAWDDLQRGWKPIMYVRSKHDKVYGVAEATPRRPGDTGQVIPRYRLIDQKGTRFIDQGLIDHDYRDNWKEITRTEAKTAWDEAVEALPEYTEREEHFISGLMIPIWDRIRGDVKLFRVLTDAGDIFIGRKIPSTEIQTTLSSLGVEATRPKLTTDRAITGLLNHEYKLELANGWKLKYARVQGEPRIELVGPSYEHQTELQDVGIFSERIGYTTRWFSPTGDYGAQVYEQLTGMHPVVNVEYLSGEDPTIDVPSAQGGFVGGRPGRSAARTKVSAIVTEKMSTGSKKADAFLRRNRGYTIDKQNPGALRNMASHLAGFVREFRFLDHLPKTTEFAQVREAFRHSVEIAKKAYTDAAEAMKWALQPIKGTRAEVRKRYDALVMKLQADSLTEDIDKGVALPPDMEEADVAAMKAEAERLYAKYPSVREAYDRLREKTVEITDMLVDMGWLSRANAKEYYFPHKVIKYLQQNRGFFGMTRKPAIPRKGYLKQRRGGYDYAIDLDYMIDHWAQVRRDIAMTKFLEKTLKQEQADYFKTEFPDWKQGDPIPAGFKEVTVLPGRFYYKTNGVSEDLAMALVAQDMAMIEAILDEKGLKEMAAVRTLLAVGKKRSFVVREPVADQVYDMPTAPISEGRLYNAVKSGNTFVKRQILFNPLYAIPFHLTNFVGDAHKVAVADPGALKSRHIPGYWKAILDAHNGKKPALFDEAQEFGVIGSGWIGVDVKRLKALLPEIEKAEISGAGKVFYGKAKRLFNLMRTAGESREDWLRYATFAHLVDLQDKGVDVTRFATKDTKLVKGLSGHEKAAKIARDILGDYSAIGKSGRMISDLFIPFYRWMHLNLPWWPRLIKEYGRRGNAGRLAAALLAAAAPYIAALLWNYSDEERRKFEEKLPPWKRWTFHIVGVHGKKLYYIPLPLDDLTNFFGVDDSLSDYTAYQKGIIDLPTLAYRIAINAVHAPATGVISAMGGVVGVARDAFGIKTFPEFADYRITDPKQRALNVVKTVFGAPGQLAEAVRRGDEVKTKDLLWRSVFGVRPWTPRSGPLVALAARTRREDQEKYPYEPMRWQPHTGDRVTVDRLKAQVTDMSRQEMKEAHAELNQRRLENYARDLRKRPEPALRRLLKNKAYGSTGFIDNRFHVIGQPVRGEEDHVKAIKAELKRRKESTR